MIFSKALVVGVGARGYSLDRSHEDLTLPKTKAASGLSCVVRYIKV